MVLILALSMLSIYGLVVAFRYDGYEEWFARIVAIVLVGLFVSTSMVAFFQNGIKIERMKLFQVTTVKNYEKIISQTLQLSDEIEKSEFSIEKFALYQSLSQRLVEFNQEITKHNSALVGYRMLKDNIFLNWYIPDLGGLEIINL